MSDSASQAMETMTIQWWNALTRSLNLGGQFQLAQGNVAVGATSPSIWSIMDTIPPKSLVNYWVPGSFNSFASNYGSVLSRIHSSASGSFQQIMADYYTAWQSYLAAHPPAGSFPAGLLSEFQSWAFTNMPPEQAEAAYTAFQSAVIDPIGQAQQMWFLAGGASGTKAYSPSIESLDNTINMAPSGGVEFNSQTESSDASHTWASGSVEGFYDVFFGEAGASYDASTVTVTNAGIDINIQFQHVTTIPVAPLETGSVVAGPTTYQAWYVPSALQTAYNNNNFQIWQPGSPDWNSFFGPTGSMPRATVGLVIVDGISVTLNSLASIDKSSQEEVKASFAAGFFPFFGTEGNGGWSNSFTYNDSGQIVATSSSPVGSPQILGILVADIPNVIASSAVMAAQRMRRGSRPRKVPALRRSIGGGNQVVPAPQVIVVAWTAAALQGLHNLGVAPNIEVLISNYVTTWAEGRAGGWALNATHTYNSHQPQYTASARVVAINGGNRTVNIVAFA